MYGPILTASPHALELAVGWEKTGQLNPVLRASDVYYGPDDVRPEPAAELKEAGLVEREGRVTDQLLDLLPSLCAAPLEYVADFRVEEKKFTALSAAAANGAVFAVRERDVAEGTDIVRFREIQPDALIDAMLDLLDLQPGSGQMVELYLQDVRERNEAVSEQPPSPEHKQLIALLERPIVGPAIEIVVGVRDSSGKLSSTHRPLHIAQLDWGHFITYTVGSGRDEQFLGGPATRDNVRKALDALRSTLSGQD